MVYVTVPPGVALLTPSVLLTAMSACCCVSTVLSSVPVAGPTLLVVELVDTRVPVAAAEMSQVAEYVTEEPAGMSNVAATPLEQETGGEFTPLFASRAQLQVARRASKVGVHITDVSAMAPTYVLRG